MCLNGKLQCLLITLLLLVATTAAQAQLKRAIDIRTLPYERSLEKLPVELTATVGFVESGGTVFVQDETAGTHLHFKPARNDLSVGDRVHIKGITMAGLYLPGIEVTELQVLGHESPPVSVRATYDDLATGRFHYQRVEIKGLGRSLTQLDENRSLLRLAIGSRVIEVRIDAPIDASPTLVDATLRITALAAGGINDRRQLVFPYLRVTDWSDIAMISPGKPFNELPRVSVTNLLRFTGKPDEAAHRVLINGVVLAQFPDGRLFARDQTPAEPSSPTSAELVSKTTPPAICIKLDAQSDLNPGDNFIASGFPVMEGFTASLADSHLIETLSGSTPVPVDVSLSALLNGSHDADLVRLDRPVTLLDQFRTSDGYELRLNYSGTTVHAFMPSEYFVGSISEISFEDKPAANIDSNGNLLLEKGATLALTGICQIESATDKGFRSLPNRISLLLRGPRDIRVLNAAPFWDNRRLLIASSSLGAVVLLTFIWILALRRRVSRLESKIIEQATLEERQRIAREFHDTLEQELAGLSLRLDAATTRPLEEKARSLLENSRKLVSRIQSEARNLVADLRNTEPAPDLVSALEEIRSQMPPNSPDLVLEIQSIPCLPPYVSHHLRMIAQETITNSVKHSRANHLKLHLSSDEQQLTLRIQDDGIGFDAYAETNGKPGHFGCMGIRERCRKIGAEVEWQSQLGHGSSLIVTLPWSAASLKSKRAV